MDILSKRLRDLRVDNDMKQGEMGAAVGITQNMVSNYENGREPPLETVLLYAKYFDVSLEYLLGLTNDPKSTNGTLEASINALARLAGDEMPTSSSVLALLDAAVVYYRKGATCGDIPMKAFNGFIDGLRNAMLAAARNDDAALIDSANAATVAALEVAKMPALYYKKKGESST